MLEIKDLFMKQNINRVTRRPPIECPNCKHIHTTENNPQLQQIFKTAVISESGCFEFKCNRCNKITEIAIIRKTIIQAIRIINEI